MYRSTSSDVIERIADGARIPPDPDNADYAAVLAWLAAGNELLPYEPPPKRAPDEVTMGQARLALHDMGKLEAVEAALAGMPEPARTRAKIEWDYRPTVRRDSPLVAQLGAALGLDAGGLDALFTHAATL
jgi:hypothetical protein